MKNTKKLYTPSGKCDNQQQYKFIIQAEMVSTPEIFTDNSQISPGTSVTVRYTIARKALRLFTGVLDVKNKTAVRRVGDAG